MTEPGAEEFLPRGRSLRTLRRAVQDCHGCDLYRDATQAVFGEGPAKARLMLIGETPGDKEDLAGEPFVGPAEAVLRKALAEAGLEVEDAYLTNAVKHFKWRPRGKRRLHVTPRVGEMNACRPWLEAEVEAVGPEAIVALGATAARSLFGTKIKVTKDRGRLLGSDLAGIAAVTIHPSAVLRAGEDRADAYASLVADLKLVAEAMSA
jgi:DNA polymerase